MARWAGGQRWEWKYMTVTGTPSIHYHSHDWYDQGNRASYQAPQYRYHVIQYQATTYT